MAISWTLKTLSDIRNEVLSIARNVLTFVTNWNETSIDRIKFEFVAQAIHIGFTWLDNNMKNLFGSTATGRFQVAKMIDVGKEMQEATSTEGYVEFTRINAAAPLTVDAGTQVITETLSDGTRKIYETKTVATFSGATPPESVSVLASCITPGEAGNVEENTINSLVTQIAGIVVNNPIPVGDTTWITIAGTDAETEESGHTRYVLAWSEVSQSGPDDAHKSWILDVPFVYDAVINNRMPRGQGSVDMYVLAKYGLPTDRMIIALTLAVANKKALCERLAIQRPEPRGLHLKATAVYDPNQWEGSASELKTALDEFAKGLVRTYSVDDTHLRARQMRINESFTWAKFAVMAHASFPCIVDWKPEIPWVSLAIGNTSLGKYAAITSITTAFSVTSSGVVHFGPNSHYINIPQVEPIVVP